MGKSVKFGHVASYSKDGGKVTASSGNIQRSRQKISKGFRNDGSGEMSPSNIGVGGVLTVTYPEESAQRRALRASGALDQLPVFEFGTYRVEEVSIQYQTERDKQGKPTGPITEEVVTYLRPTAVLGDGPNVLTRDNEGKAIEVPFFDRADWENRPRSYVRKVGGEVIESLNNF